MRRIYQLEIQDKFGRNNYMSQDDFYGRPLSRGFSSLEFEICEVCQRKSPTWLEASFDENIPVVRFVCNECHEDFEKIDDNTTEVFTRQIEDDEEIPETTRPGWVDDFIKNQEETGSIQSIDPSEDVAQVENYSEAPSDFNQEQEFQDSDEEKHQEKIAPWAPKFIQEALFGPNPEKWLEENAGYEKNNLKLTIKTLNSFINHDISSVKLSAIKCLVGVVTRHKSQKDNILNILSNYTEDDDETVSEFAKETINQIN